MCSWRFQHFRTLLKCFFRTPYSSPATVQNVTMNIRLSKAYWLWLRNICDVYAHVAGSGSHRGSEETEGCATTARPAQVCTLRSTGSTQQEDSTQACSTGDQNRCLYRCQWYNVHLSIHCPVCCGLWADIIMSQNSHARSRDTMIKPLKKDALWLSVLILGVTTHICPTLLYSVSP